MKATLTKDSESERREKAAAEKRCMRSQFERAKVAGTVVVPDYVRAARRRARDIALNVPAQPHGK